MSESTEIAMSGSAAPPSAEDDRLTGDAGNTAEALIALTRLVEDLRDREQIRELFTRYGLAADTGDAREWSETYAATGTYDGVGGRMTGRAQFFDAIDNPTGVHKRDIECFGSLHTTGPLTMRIDGDSAWAEGYAIVWIRSADASYRVYSMSYNHWDLQRSGGKWEIFHRRSRPVSPGAATAVFTEWKAAGPLPGELSSLTRRGPAPVE